MSRIFFSQQARKPALKGNGEGNIYEGVGERVAEGFRRCAPFRCGVEVDLLVGHFLLVFLLSCGTRSALGAQLRRLP